MLLGSIQMRTLFPSYDEKASQPVTSFDVPSIDLIDHDGGSTGGTNYWVNDDPRPTKEEVLDKLEDFQETIDIIDYLLPESIKSNIPPWLRPPLDWMVPVAEVIVEIDPLDRIQD